MKRLVENLQNPYFLAANKLNSRSARQRVVAYVESYDDVFFWRTVLQQFESSKYYFEVMLPDKWGRLERGKKAAIMHVLSSHLGQNMLACVDADYDYLRQGRGGVSKQLIDNPYIIHTQAYAIDNLFCYAPSLHNVCVAVTLNDEPVFDCEAYLKQYSLIIYPLFVWNIWCYREGLYNAFSMTDFLRVIDLGNFKIGAAQVSLEHLQKKVERRVRELQKQYAEHEADYNALKKELYQLGVKPEECYLYIQGHHVMDKVVVPMLKRVCDYLFNLRQQDITRKSQHLTQCNNELKSYSHSVENIALALKRNVGWLNSSQYQAIAHQLEQIFPKEETSPLIHA